MHIQGDAYTDRLIIKKKDPTWSCTKMQQ